MVALLKFLLATFCISLIAWLSGGLILGENEMLTITNTFKVTYLSACIVGSGIAIGRLIAGWMEQRDRRQI